MSEVSYGKQVATDAPSPLFQSINVRLDTANNRLKINLDQLEDKLHNIINKRTPEKQSAQEKNMDNDAAQVIDSQLQKLLLQNERFERLLSHLSEII